MNHEQHTELLPLGQAGNQFELALRGYDRGQVDEHLLRLEDDLRVALADRDIAAARSADLAAQLAAAHGEIEALRTTMHRLELPTPENIGERVRHMLALAEEEANEVRSRAHEDTAALQARADRLSAEIEAKHGEADGYAGRLISEAEQRATAILAEAERKAQQAVADAQREQERRDQQALANRQQADEDFNIALRARRSEQAALDEQRRAAVAHECDQRLAAARAEAAELVARARERVDVLRTQRRQVLEHLAGIRSALDGMPSAEALEAAEQEELAQVGAATPTQGRPAP